MLDFRLHSKGENWWHFRKDLDSIARSFTVTVVHDGTVVLSGDYYLLAFRCEWDARRNFPNNETGIDYFAEKVITPTTEWNFEAAIEDLKDSIKENTDGISLINERLAKVDDWSECETQSEFITQCRNEFDNLEVEDCVGFGVRYTDRFKHQFELLKFWSEFVAANKDLWICEKSGSCKIDCEHKTCHKPTDIVNNIIHCCYLGHCKTGSSHCVKVGWE
jgi:hypothetical protein